MRLAFISLMLLAISCGPTDPAPDGTGDPDTGPGLDMALLPKLAFVQEWVTEDPNQFDAANSRWTRLGYEPATICIDQFRNCVLTDREAGPAASVLWHKTPYKNPTEADTVADVQMTRSELDAADLRYKALEYYMIDLDARRRSPGETTWYSAIWVKSERVLDSQWAADLTREQLDSFLQTARTNGYRPLRLNGYAACGEPASFTVVVVDDRIATNPDLDWTAEILDTGAEFESRNAQLRADGFHCVDTARFQDGHVVRYAGIWVQDPEIVASTVRHDVCPGDAFSAGAAGVDACPDGTDANEAFWRVRRDLKRVGWQMVDIGFHWQIPASDVLGDPQAWHHGVWVRYQRRNELLSNRPLDDPPIADLKVTLATFPGDIGFVVVDRRTNNYVAYNHHEAFYCASTTKVLIGTKVLQDAEAGALDGTNALSDTRVLQDHEWLHSRSSGNNIPDPAVPGNPDTYTYERLLEWMLDFSDTTATDTLVGAVGGNGALNDYLLGPGRRFNIGEITTICELDKRILSGLSPELAACLPALGCRAFERVWRNSTTEADPSYIAPGTEECLSDWATARSMLSSAASGAVHERYYHTLANSATPAEFARFWGDLLDGNILVDTNGDGSLGADSGGSQGAAILARILDYRSFTTCSPWPGPGTDPALGGYNHLAGKGGDKRRVHARVGLAWNETASAEAPPADGQYEYTYAVFTKNWLDGTAAAVARTAVCDVLDDAIRFLAGDR